MSLLDPNVKEIIFKEPKLSWKQKWVYGTKEHYLLEDRDGNLLGEFVSSQKIKNHYDLYDADKNTILSLIMTGIFNDRPEIRSSSGSFLGKITLKRKLDYDSRILKSPNDEILLKHKYKGWRGDFIILDSKEKTIAEFSWKKPRLLKIHDTFFDRCLLLGFLFGSMVMPKGGGGSGG